MKKEEDIETDEETNWFQEYINLNKQELKHRFAEQKGFMYLGEEDQINKFIDENDQDFADYCAEQFNKKKHTMGEQ